MYSRTTFWDDKRVVSRTCPNAGHPCNCIGVCLPITVSKDDPRSDEEIRADWAAARIRSWSSTTSSMR